MKDKLDLRSEYDLTKEIEKYMKMSAKERAEMLNAALYQTVEQVLKIAAVVEAMAQMEDDLAKSPSWWVANMRRIAAGTMLPQVFTMFDGSLRNKIAALPVQDQKRLTDKPVVELVVVKDGKTEILRADPRKLEVGQVRQVFSRGCLRDAAEQRSYLENQTFPKAKLKDDMACVKDASACSIKKGYLFVPANTRLSRKDLLGFLGQME